MNFRDIIYRQINEKIIHGCVLMAGQGSNISFFEAFGQARAGIAIQLDSIFDLASVTKVLATASACAICFDRNILDYEKPLVEYLPELNGKISTKVNLRNLLTHISGLAFTNFTADSKEPEELFSTVYQFTEPAKEWRYSCLEYIIAGLIVERVSGEPFRNFVEKNILLPIGMNETAWGPIQCTDRVTEAICPEPGQISDGNAYFMSRQGRYIGNAGLFSTAMDMSKFCQAILNINNKVFSERALAKLTLNAIPDPEMQNHSLGWSMDRDFIPNWMSENTIFHSGWTGNSIWVDPATMSWFIFLGARYGDYDKAKATRLQIANGFNVHNGSIVPL